MGAVRKLALRIASYVYSSRPRSKRRVNFRGPLQTKISVEETVGGKFVLAKQQKHNLGSTCLFSVAVSSDVSYSSFALLPCAEHASGTFLQSTRIAGGAQECVVIYTYLSDSDTYVLHSFCHAVLTIAASLQLVGGCAHAS